MLLSLAAAACAVTIPAGHADVAKGFNYGNATIAVYLPKNGAVVGGRLASGGMQATLNPDGSISAKIGWWRAGTGRPRISGRRVDGAAPPLRAHVPAGYGRGFQATGLTFPTPGCWRVIGRYAGAQLAFTVRVTRSRLGP